MRLTAAYTASRENASAELEARRTGAAQELLL
jgi:hypothetical protein